MDAREFVGKPLTHEKNKIGQNALIHWLRVIANVKMANYFAEIFSDVEGKYSCR